jgi:putative ABC transport system permease protein
MPLPELLRLALGSIRATRLRSLLTTLGIVIGVGAVITMVALGSGAQAAVEAQLDNLGTDLLTVSSGQQRWQGVARAERVALTTADAEALRLDAPTLKAVIPRLGGNQQIKYRNRNANMEVTGTTADFPAANRVPVSHGRFFTPGEDQARQRVAVVGVEVVEELEVTPEELLGSTVLIRAIPFTVIGILEPRGNQPGGGNPDESIFIPFRTAELRVFGTDRLRDITVQVAEGVTVDAALLDVERVLRREHRLRPDQGNDFQIRDRSTFLTAQAEASETMTWLLAGIATVSLVVGGIGIMNIMLVSVTERTREIGLRKALGATRRQVLLQFIIEALVLSMLGGIVGILAGVGSATLLASLNGWEVLVSPQVVIFATLFSASIGLFFGVWPARRAAALDPIEALRHD